jgi:hypothetical protein
MWSWSVLVTRPALSVFQSVYRFSRVAGPRVFELWPTVRRELRILTGLLPLLWADLASVFLPKVVASDASLRGQGVVAATVPAPLVAASVPAPSLYAPDASAPSDPPGFPRPLCGARWYEIVSSPWFFSAPGINTFEMLAALTAVRWVASSPLSFGTRALLLMDNASCVFALRKGRSSAPWLLRPLRCIAALALACGLQVHCRWVPSGDNPADAASRRF